MSTSASRVSMTFCPFVHTIGHGGLEIVAGLSAHRKLILNAHGLHRQGTPVGVPGRAPPHVDDLGVAATM
eukprot:scaffold442_cov397-Prasinococcus_capsulatus_cf.AAC.53